MKKGLFSILAGALLVVGCQNYDDQFSNIESQITALASQVAGLSQVQSDLTALAGTVNSLETSVANTVDTALADGLADITTDINTLEGLINDVASAEAVTELTAAVSNTQGDLNELLANSSVFNNSLTVNSVSTLEAFYAMGSSLNIVNGSVNITVNASMDATQELKDKVQGLINNILTVTGDFNFTGTSTTAMPTFLKLTGVQSTTIKGAGEYRLDNLVSAGNIVLNNTYKSKVTIVHLGALTTYAKLSDNALVAGTVDMGSATEFHLTSLAIPAGGALNITTKKDATVALTALTGLNSLGTTQVMTLAFDGAKDISLTNIKDGTITLENVENATISDFYGSIDINGGVENLTVTKGVTLDLVGAADLITATIDMATDYDPLLSTAASTAAALASTYKALTFASQDLTTATVSGKVGTLTVDGQNNLTSLTVTGHTTALVAQNNSDLDTLTVTAATIGNVTVDNNDNMINLTLDHTTYVTAVAGNLGRAISVDGNADLETLTIDANLIDDLSIQLNPDLVTITAGATLLTTGELTATVAIDNNDLTAVKATDNYQAASTAAAPVADAGLYDSGTSGMNTFKVYLGVAAAAPAAGGVKVFFDNISEYSVQGSSATAVYTDTAVPAVAYTASNIYAVVYEEISNAVATGRITRQNMTLVLPIKRDANGSPTALNQTAGQDKITVVNGVGGTISFEGTTAITTVDNLVAAMNGNTTVANVAVSSDRDAFHEQITTIAYTSSDGTAAAVTATVVSGQDKLYFTYGTDPTTGLPIATQATLIAGDTADDIADSIAIALNAATNAYNATGTNASGLGKLLITANVSGTNLADRGPHPFAFQTLTIVTATDSTTVLLAGANAQHILAASSVSNTTAIASGLFNLTQSTAAYSGVRVTIKNTSTTLAANAMSVTFVGTSSVAFAPNVALLVNNDVIGLGTNAQGLIAGGNIVASTVVTATLDYISGFADVEDQVTPTNTAGTTDRTGWLGV